MSGMGTSTLNRHTSDRRLANQVVPIRQLKKLTNILFELGKYICVRVHSPHMYSSFCFETSKQIFHPRLDENACFFSIDAQIKYLSIL